METAYFIPSQFGTWFLHDSNCPDSKRDDLQWYFNDLYKFFLYTLTKNTHDANSITEEQEKKLLGMLSEIVSVKNMLEEDAKKKNAK